MFGSKDRQEPTMLAPIIFVSLILAMMVLSGRFTAKQAAHRGRSTSAWFIWGALLFPLFPLASIVLVLLPARDRATAR
jgi:hypothetical protein